MKFSIAFLLTFTLFQSQTLAQEALKLKPFETDGCTMFADGTSENPTLWKHCCTIHDLRYWFGGEKKEMDFADIKLRDCVKDVANENWAQVIYMGVRAGHHSPIKSKYAWNWGWTSKRALIPFSPQEESYIKSELKKLESELSLSVTMDEFIKTYFNQKAL